MGLSIGRRCIVYWISLKANTAMRTVTFNRRVIAILVFLAIAYFIYLKHFRGVTQEVKKADFQDSRIVRSGKQDKIASDGHYSPFYGYTIIAPVVEWKKCVPIQEYITNSKTLSKFISPLPASSYHVTIFEIFSQRDVPKKYKPLSGHVPSIHWSSSLSALKNDLTKAQKKCDLFDQQIQFRPEKFKMGSTALSATGTLSNVRVISKLRKELSDIFKTHKKQLFHLGLGYIYRDITERDMEEINKELEGLRKVLSQSYLLYPPKVYYFETMEEFIPFMDAGLF